MRWVLSAPRRNPASVFVEREAKKRGWTRDKRNSEGHRKFTWTDDYGNVHIVIAGSGGHSEKKGIRDAQATATRMDLCMSGNCTHIFRDEAGQDLPRGRKPETSEEIAPPTEAEEYNIPVQNIQIREGGYAYWGEEIWYIHEITEGDDGRPVALLVPVPPDRAELDDFVPIDQLTLEPAALSKAASRKHSVYGESGENWKICSDGVERWGLYGAAGLMIRRRREDGQLEYLLSERSAEVDDGGVWGIPGGALDRSETPLEGALRETQEELGALPPGYSVIDESVFQPADDWSYTTIIVEISEPDYPSQGVDLGWEHTGFDWFTFDEAFQVPLHPGVENVLGSQKNARRLLSWARPIFPGDY